MFHMFQVSSPHLVWQVQASFKLESQLRVLGRTPGISVVSPSPHSSWQINSQWPEPPLKPNCCCSLACARPCVSRNCNEWPLRAPDIAGQERSGTTESLLPVQIAEHGKRPCQNCTGKATITPALQPCCCQKLKPFLLVPIHCFSSVTGNELPPM